jgi:uncharacterized membrane protein YbhN (UPF0104 family)
VNTDEKFPDKKESGDLFKSIRISRIVFPIIFGIIVVAYLFWRKFDAQAFENIDWDTHAIFWLGIAVIAFGIRHIVYSWRLRILTSNHFSWLKCIELIFIWEFASAVSPTALGGSATAIILLSQERFPTAKTVSVILYSVVLDTLFFLIMIPLVYMVFGPMIIRPEMDMLSDIDGYGYTFIVVMISMLIYGGFFFYGLFIDPRKLKSFLYWFSKLTFIKKFKEGIRKTGDEIVISSKELYKKDWRFHAKAMLATSLGWILKFLVLNALYIAIIDLARTDFLSQFLLYARNQTMFAITAFSPTPGGSGVAEMLFNGFFLDFIPEEISVIILSVWRFMTYYIYLFAGVIIVPNWINKIILKRKNRRRSNPDVTKS